MSTIPANLFASVTPSVLAPGGAELNMVAVILTDSTRVPTNTVMSFPNAVAVSNFFGPTSQEAALAAIYFAGFSGAATLPGSLLFAQYNQSDVAAYLRGGNVSALTLAQLQALSGTFAVTMDGYNHNAGSVSLAAATSFTNAASIINTALNASEPVEAVVTASMGSTFVGTQSGTTLTAASVTGLISVGDTIAGTGVAVGTKILSQSGGTPGGNGTYVTSLSGTAASASCTGTSNVLDVTGVTSGVVAVGLTGTGSGMTAATITAEGTGTGAIGTYIMNGSQQTVASTTVTLSATAPTVSYDSVSGAFVVTSGIVGAASTAAFATGTLAPEIDLTQQTGATLSQGQAAQTPSSIMNQITANTMDWGTFMTSFDPDGGMGNTLKQGFAAWKNTFPNRFAYIAWDPDITPTTEVPASSCLAQILDNNGDSGTCVIYDVTVGNLAAFICGAAASIDFEQPNGRITFAFKGAADITPSVTSATVAENLGGNPQIGGEGNEGNGENYYGAVGSAGQQFQWFQRGFVTGPFEWLDSYINQIWLNNQFQNAMLNLQNSARSIPYNTNGANLLEGALSDPIQAGLSFGAFGPGTLSSSQIAEVNSQAGANISDALQAQGYYLQILPATATQRANRTSPPATFWYIDNGSVQSLALSSVAIQ